MTEAETLKGELRRDLRAAMKRSDKVETALLRQLIAALDNAEAVPVREECASLVRHVFGEGTAEVERRLISRDDAQAVMQAEMQARMEAAAEFARLGMAARAARLEAEVGIVRRYIRP